MDDLSQPNTGAPQLCAGAGQPGQPEQPKKEKSLSFGQVTSFGVDFGSVPLYTLDGEAMESLSP